MKKKIMCLAMIALMVIGTPLTAHAEDFKSTKAWNVNFDGKNMKGNFNSSEISEDILNNIQPGDSITLQIELKNASEGKADWYMSNKVLQSLEDSNKSAVGGAYTYILTYHAPDGTNSVLYNNDEVGGDSSNNNGAGLREVSDNLEEYFYLGRMDNGKSGKISLYVELDGETQDNNYQKTLAKLQMSFAVEKVTEKTVSKTVVKKETKDVVTYVAAPPTVGAGLKTAVNTGDASHGMLFASLALVSGLAMLGCSVIGMKRTKVKGE